MAIQQLKGTKRAVLTGFLLMLLLNFLYQFSIGMDNVLNHHFQSGLHLSPLQSTFIQFTFFIGFFVAPLPANYVMQRLGYKGGILVGLLLYIIGSLIFVPATVTSAYSIFLAALFILAVGAAFIETGADPYLTVLGAPEHSERRINLGHAFGGLGQFIAPAIAGAVFYTSLHHADKSQNLLIKAHNATGVEYVYVAVALVSVAAFLVTLFLKIPDIRHDEKTDIHQKHFRYLWSRKHFVQGVVTQFFEVAAQVSIAAFYMDYLLHSGFVSSTSAAAYLFTTAMLIFIIGRFVTTGILYLTKIDPRKVQIFYAVMCILCLLPVIASAKEFAVISLTASFFFISVLYPTNFALAVKDLGSHTKRASSLMIMALSGGAVGALVTGAIADHSISLAFIAPAVFLTGTVFYALRGYKVTPLSEDK